MRLKILVFIFILFAFETISAQSLILKPAFLKYEIDSSTKIKILISLDTLFSQIKNNNIDTSLIVKENAGLSISIMQSFSDIDVNKKDSVSDFYKKQLINFYPLSSDEFWISLGLVGSKSIETPIIKAIINLIAKRQGDKILFSIPTKFLTRTWKTQTVGNITYFFRDKIKVERATKFNGKNTTIANKLGLKPEKLNFYLCDNYQEILQLLGYEYDMESNGETRGGYGVEANTIFAVMNNEDFSHDVFHYYSEKIRGESKRNRTVEEGIAYSWGNAYYTKANGEMVEQKELVQNLKNYLKQHPKTNLLELFNKDTKIFASLATEFSVKSTISSLLCDEVEQKKGIDGIKELIKCGRGDENFFRTLHTLISIDQNNFDMEVTKLIEQYKKK